MFEDKSIISAEQLRKTVEDLDARGEKRLGPMLIAKAWTDPAFKAKLLRNAGDAAEELGIQSSNFAPKPKAAGVVPSFASCTRVHQNVKNTVEWMTGFKLL